MNPIRENHRKTLVSKKKKKINTKQSSRAPLKEKVAIEEINQKASKEPVKVPAKEK